MNATWKQRMHTQRVIRKAVKRRNIVAAKRIAAADSDQRYRAWRKRRLTNVRHQMALEHSWL